VRVTAPDTDVVAAVVDQWVALAAEQRDHGSHLPPEANRSVVRDAIARHIVTGGVLVARDESDDLLGFVMFSPESGTYEEDVDRGLVQNIYVVPERRGEGIGTELLASAEETLSEMGADVVTLEAMAANEAARRFYRRHGYHTHRVTLEKPLDESDTHSKEDDEGPTAPE
jgi:ribosomal protein S18 acetylase RimI-like enzyme